MIYKELVGWHRTSYRRMFGHVVVKKEQTQYVSSLASRGEKKDQQPLATIQKKEATTDSVDETKTLDLQQLRQTNCGRLWLERGLSVQDIAFCLRMHPNAVLNNIFSYARKIENPDWGRLCRLVNMTPGVAESILQARVLAKKDATNISVPDIMKFCPRKVTSLHIGLVHAMLGHGLSSSEILQKSKAEQMDPDSVATESRVSKESDNPVTGSYERQEEGSLNTAAEENGNSEPKAIESFHTDPGIKSKANLDCMDNLGTRKKIVTESELSTWLQGVDGATLSDIAQTFEDCDEVYLMRLIIEMVENSIIVRGQGKFWIQSKNYRGSKTEDANHEDK